MMKLGVDALYKNIDRVRIWGAIIVIIIVVGYTICRAPWGYSFRGAGGQVEPISQKYNRKDEF